MGKCLCQKSRTVIWLFNQPLPAFKVNDEHHLKTERGSQKANAQ